MRRKKDGSYRMILNLKDMNKLIEKKKFKMETLKSAISLMKENCFFASLDLKEAYFSVNIRKEFRKLFRFRFDGILYEFMALPQGYTESPRIFTKLLKPVLGFLRSRGHNLVAYIDDSLLQGDTKEECFDNVRETGELMDNLGYTVHPEKSVFQPNQRILFLGFLLDSISMTVSVSDEKRTNVCEKIVKLLEKKRCSIRDFASVLGSLVALDPGVWIGPIFWKRLEIEKIQQLRYSKYNYEKFFKLSKTAKEDLTWWLENMQNYPSPVKQNHPKIVLYSDASKNGWGAVRDSNKTGGLWTEEEKSQHINELELMAVLFGLKSLCDDIFDEDIKVMTDNSTTVACINKKGSTKTKCNDITRDIWLWCLAHRLCIMAVHIPGVDNVEADKESRKENTFSEWSLKDEVFRQLENRFGPFHVDMFATRINSKLSTFVSWKPDPFAWAVDAFTCKWDLEGMYCFPPIVLISRLLKKVEREKATVTLVAPLWRNQVWFPQLLRMLINYPVLLPNKNILTHPTKNQNSCANLQMMCCVISGDTSKTTMFQEELGISSVNLGETRPKNRTQRTSNNGCNFVLRGISIPWIQL